MVIIVGFLQGFIGLDNADNTKDSSFFILESMAKVILQSPEFEGFDNFAREWIGFSVIVLELIWDSSRPIWNHPLLSVHFCGDGHPPKHPYRVVQFGVHGHH